MLAPFRPPLPLALALATVPLAQQALAPARADLDGDGRAEVLSVGVDGALRLFATTAEGSLDDISTSAGIPAELRARSAELRDLDGDGTVEILIVDADGALRLLRRVGAPHPVVFEEHLLIAAGTLPGEVSALSVLDWDRDGLFDLALTTGAGPVLLHATPGLRYEPALLGGPLDIQRGTGAAAAGGDPMPGTPAPAIPRTCAISLRDAANGLCIVASTVPLLGALLPLGPELFVDGAANVGIGTMSPTAKLHVAGGLRVDEQIHAHSASLRNLGGTISFDGPLGTTIKQQGNSAELLFRSTDSDGGGPQLRMRGRIVDGTYTHPERARIDAEYGNNDSPTPPGVFRAMHGSTAHLVVDEDGDVGIGSSSPSDTLTVEGQVRLAPSLTATVSVHDSEDLLRVESDGSSVFKINGGSINDDTYLQFSEKATGSQWRVGMDDREENWGDLAIKQANNAAPNIHFEKVLGFVGIGTTTPGALLDVGGDFDVDAGTLSVDATGDRVDVGGGFSVSGNALRVDPISGDVGLGTSTPAADLDVAGDLTVDGGTLSLISATSKVAVDGTLDAAGGLLVVDAATDRVAVDGAFDAGVGTLNVTALGSVGIGTAVPSEALEVAGDLRVKGNTLVVDDVQDRVGIGTSAPQLALDVAGTLRVNGTDLFVDAPGNEVGIGTSFPSDELSVDGTIDVQGLRFPGGSLQTSAAEAFPTGVIVLWSGTLGSIPSGWALCNGSNGTPDLRERFVYGWSAGQNPGATGGVGHNHVSQNEVFDIEGSQGSAMVAAASGNPVAVASASHDHNLPSNSYFAISEVEEPLPPYFELAYIIKVDA